VQKTEYGSPIEPVTIIETITSLAPFIAKWFKNLPFEARKVNEDLVRQIEELRESVGEERRWAEGRSLLTQIIKYHSRQRTSWWPPDKDRALKKFQEYVKRLQEAAQAEVARLQAKMKPAVAAVPFEWKRWVPWIVGGGVGILGIAILAKILRRKK